MITHTHNEQLLPLSVSYFQQLVQWRPFSTPQNIFHPTCSWTDTSDIYATIKVSSRSLRCLHSRHCDKERSHKHHGQLISLYFVSLITLSLPLKASCLARLLLFVPFLPRLLLCLILTWVYGTLPRSPSAPSLSLYSLDTSKLCFITAASSLRLASRASFIPSAAITAIANLPTSPAAGSADVRAGPHSTGRFDVFREKLKP